MIVQPTLPTMLGANLGPQIHAGKQPTAKGFIPATDGSATSSRFKPNGGLWTSTLIDGTTGWVDWCRGEDFGGVDAHAWWQVTPEPDARVLVIDGERDLRAVAEAFPRDTGYVGIPYIPERTVSFEAMIAAGYAGLRVTHEGHWETRYLHGVLNTYSWDCESTVWLSWCFTDVTCYREAQE